MNKAKLGSELFDKAWEEESKDISFKGIDDLKALAWMWTGWRRAFEVMEKELEKRNEDIASNNKT